VISAINTATGGKVTAGINSTDDGLLLLQVGGTGNASVSEVDGGTTAAALNIKGTFTNGKLDGELPPTLPSSAVFGIGATLSNLVTRFSDAQTGVLFDTSTALESEETQLTSQQTSLTTLLNDKKNVLSAQFANLETTIANLQSQGSAIAGISSTTSSSSTKSS
jgi:flagellar capping protein FliD